MLGESADPELKNWRELLNKLHRALDSASENGLFDNKPKITYEEILNITIEGLEDLSGKEPKILDARRKFSLACHKFDQQINHVKFKWRFTYYYGGPAVVYLLSLLIALLSGWFFFQSSLLEYSLFWVPSWAFLWGAIGAILHGFWWIWQHVSLRKFRKAWYVWYFLLPIIGSLLGALVYLVFISGLFATTGDVTVESQTFLILLSALAGFSAKWAVETLGKLTEVLKIAT